MKKRNDEEIRAFKIEHTNGKRTKYYVLEIITENLLQPLWPGKLFKSEHEAKKALDEYLYGKRPLE